MKKGLEKVEVFWLKCCKSCNFPTVKIFWFVNRDSDQTHFQGESR